MNFQADKLVELDKKLEYKGLNFHMMNLYSPHCKISWQKGNRCSMLTDLLKSQGCLDGRNTFCQFWAHSSNCSCQLGSGKAPHHLAMHRICLNAMFAIPNPESRILMVKVQGDRGREGQEPGGGQKDLPGGWSLLNLQIENDIMDISWSLRPLCKQKHQSQLSNIYFRTKTCHI